MVVGDRQRVSRKARGSGDLVSQGHRRRPKKAIHEPDTVDDFRIALSQMEKHGWTNLVAAIRRMLAGERNEQALYARLDLEDSMISETIIRAIADATTLSGLLPAEGAGS